jgi:hypothetical protein
VDIKGKQAKIIEAQEKNQKLELQLKEQRSLTEKALKVMIIDMATNPYRTSKS